MTEYQIKNGKEIQYKLNIIQKTTQTKQHL